MTFQEIKKACEETSDKALVKSKRISSYNIRINQLVTYFVNRAITK